MDAPDLLRRRTLRRAKVGATALLLVAAAAYVATYQVAGGGAGWLGFVRAAAEAGMVGGLADWFAVTALFRHPLGLPVPHTAIIPTRKDAIGRSLEEFVASNFLGEEVVLDRLRTAAVPARLGAWIATPRHARRLADEGAALVTAAVRTVSVDDLDALLTRTLERRLAEISVAARAGAALDRVVRSGAHHRLVDLVVARLADYADGHRGELIDLITRQAPDWTPSFVDRRVAVALYERVAALLHAVQADPDHDLRGQLDDLLLDVARNLREDSEFAGRTDRYVASLINQPAVRDTVAELVADGRIALLDLLGDADGELRSRITGAIEAFGARFADDPELAARVEERLAQAARYLLAHYRDEITGLIGDTVARWDARDTSRRIELQVGRDLQFIRVNGTVVGALAGVAIHAVTLALH